jgi:DNA-damage-inducible protein J
MTRSAEIKFRTEPDLKADVQAIFAEIGLSMSDALNLMLRRVRAEHGIPGEFKVPNAETRAAMLEDFSARKGQGYKNLQDLLTALNADDTDTNILIADEDFRVGERGKAEGVDIRSMTEAAGVAQPARSLQVRRV